MRGLRRRGGFWKWQGRNMGDRPSYRRALCWLVCNDDCEWLADPEPAISVTAAMVSDMFGKSDEVVIRDLRKMRAQINQEDA